MKWIAYRARPVLTGGGIVMVRPGLAVGFATVLSTSDDQNMEWSRTAELYR
jgi:hypothetical protein